MESLVYPADICIKCIGEEKSPPIDQESSIMERSSHRDESNEKPLTTQEVVRRGTGEGSFYNHKHIIRS